MAGLTFPTNPTDGQTVENTFTNPNGETITKRWVWSGLTMGWIASSPVDTSVFVLNSGDEMTGPLVMSFGGKTATFTSSGITFGSDASSFNLVAQNTYNTGSSGFDAETQKVINIDSSTNNGLWRGFNVKNQLAVGPETLYLNKGKHAAQPSGAVADCFLGGGVAGNSHSRDIIRFSETDTDNKYPSHTTTYVKKIINKNSMVPVWLNGTDKKFLQSNLSTIIGNFSDAGLISERASGVITHHGKLFRTLEKVSSTTSEGGNAFAPEFINDGFYLPGYKTHRTQLILGGYNLTGDSENPTPTIKLIYQDRNSLLGGAGSSVFTDQVGGYTPKNIVEEKEYGMTAGTIDGVPNRRTAVLYTVNGVEPPIFYSSGLTSVGATAGLIFGFIDKDGGAWERKNLNVTPLGRDAICQSPLVLCSYNMQKAETNPSGGNFIDSDSYVDLLVDNGGTYKRTVTKDKITFTTAVGNTWNAPKFAVKDTLVENFGDWNRLWVVYDQPVNSDIIRSNGSIPNIMSWVHHPEMIAIKYNTPTNMWEREYLDEDTGIYDNNSLSPFRLSYSPMSMTAWIDGINPAKCHYSFITKGEEYYCDMDGAGATYYYNVYAGGHFDYSYNGSPYEQAKIDPCFDGVIKNNFDNGIFPGNCLQALDDTSAEGINYKFPFVIYYKIRMSDGKVMDGPISAKLPIFDYDNSNQNTIKIQYSDYSYGGETELAPIYSSYPTRYIVNIVNQMCANACVETYDFAVEKRMLNVFGGSVNVSDNENKSRCFAIRCAIGATGTLMGGLTGESDNRWRNMSQGLDWPGYPNIYTANMVGPLQKHRSPQYGLLGEFGFERCPIIGGVINDYIGEGLHGWQFPRGHLVRWSGYSYDSRDDAGLNMWTSTQDTFVNWQYLRKVFGTSQSGTLSDREWPNVEILSRVGYNTNMGYPNGATGNPRGAILTLPLWTIQKMLNTAFFTETSGQALTRRI